MLFNIKSLALVLAAANVVLAAPAAEPNPEALPESNPEASPEAEMFDKRATSYSIWLTQSGYVTWGGGRDWSYSLFDGTACNNRWSERKDRNYGTRGNAFDPSSDKPLKFDNVGGYGTVDFWPSGKALLAYRAGGDGKVIGTCLPIGPDNCWLNERKWVCGLL